MGFEMQIRKLRVTPPPPPHHQEGLNVAGSMPNPSLWTPPLAGCKFCYHVSLNNSCSSINRLPPIIAPPHPTIGNLSIPIMVNLEDEAEVGSEPAKLISDAAKDIDNEN